MLSVLRIIDKTEILNFTIGKITRISSIYGRFTGVAGKFRGWKMRGDHLATCDGDDSSLGRGVGRAEFILDDKALFF